MITINGKQYPLWSQFVERKKEWIGSILEDSGDPMDRSFGFRGEQTTITDIVLKENGEDSAFFEVIGIDFSCGFDVKHGGIVGGNNEYEWISFSGYNGHKWRIKGNAQ